MQISGPRQHGNACKQTRRLFQKQCIFFLFFCLYSIITFSQVEIPLAAAAYYNKSTKATDVYFYVSTPGELTAVLKLRPAEEKNLAVAFDQAAFKKISVKKTRSADGFDTVGLGSFNAGTAGYHKISVAGLQPSPAAFLLLSGPAAKDIVFNNSEYRGAPSTHLRYSYPKDSAVNAFISQ